MSVGSTRRFWESSAQALALRINLAAWLERAAPIFFFVASASAIGVYALRRAQASPTPAWLGLAGALLVAGFILWWCTRKNFFSAAEARVLLESELRLDTRLTAATAGLVPWPAALASAPRVVRWQLQAPSGWLTAALALLAAALFVPIPRETTLTRRPGPPPALLQTDTMLQQLKEMKIADPQAIEQLAERNQELMRRPMADQYKHSALEAADALRDQTAAATAQLGRGLDSAANALRSPEQGADMKSAAGRLSAALAGLRDGTLPANRDLLSQLGQAGADLSSLTPQQRADLAKQLAQAAQQMQGVAGAAGRGAPVARPDPNGALQPGDGTTPGYGGPGGKGDAPAPLALAENASETGDGKGEGLLNAEALKRLGLGDKLGTTSSAHDLDPTQSAGPMSAGAIATPAQGGEAVWVNRLTPAERAALKDFFK